MARFQMENEQHPWRRMLLSAAVFLCFLGLFLAGVDSVSESTRRRQRESLETAIANGITYCYAMDGEYSQSLEELAARYVLTYYTSRFFVDYRVNGANLYPDVTIIYRGEES